MAGVPKQKGLGLGEKRVTQKNRNCKKGFERLENSREKKQNGGERNRVPGGSRREKILREEIALRKEKKHQELSMNTGGKGGLERRSK